MGMLCNAFQARERHGNHEQTTHFGKHNDETNFFSITQSHQQTQILQQRKRKDRVPDLELLVWGVRKFETHSCEKIEQILKTDFLHETDELSKKLTLLCCFPVFWALSFLGGSVTQTPPFGGFSPRGE